MPTRRSGRSNESYGSYEALLEDTDIDAVYISLPNTHALRVVDPCRRGRQACHLREAAGAVTRRTSSGHSTPRRAPGACSPRRSCTATTRRRRQLAELVRDGAIGELRVVRSAFSYSLYDTANIRLRTDVEGGSLMDVGCYCVSGSRLLAGEPESVFGQASHRAERNGLGLCRHDALPRRRASRSSTAERHCPIETSSRRSVPKGSLFLDDPWHCHTPRDRGAQRRRDRANRARPGRLVPAGAREPERRDPAAKPRSCSVARTPSLRRGLSKPSTAPRRR